jgi:hypothetical protein
VIPTGANMMVDRIFFGVETICIKVRRNSYVDCYFDNLLVIIEVHRQYIIDNAVLLLVKTNANK